MIEYLCKEGTYNGYISPTFAQGRKVYSEIIKLLEPTGIIKKANASELLITTTFGSSLKFFTMQNPTAIRGFTIDGLLVLDECAYYADVLPDGTDPWSSVIMPITKARKPKVLLISTPNGKRGMFYSMYLKAVQGVKGYYEISATIYDDELVTEDEIEDIKKAVSPLAYRQEFLVEWLDNALTVFPNFETCFDIDEYSGGKCWCGIDPSSVGEDNTIITFVNEKDEIRQYKIDGDLDSKYRQIAAKINEFAPVATYIESNSIGDVMANEIKKKLNRKSNFYGYKTTNDTKKEYISILAVAIANNEIHFEKDNKLLYSELGTYSFNITKAGNITYAARQGFHDDTISSLAIALKCKEDYKHRTHNNNTFITAFGSRGWAK
jgi:hypothetical protein